jgi:hypothetical protein
MNWKVLRFSNFKTILMRNKVDKIDKEKLSNALSLYLKDMKTCVSDYSFKKRIIVHSLIRQFDYFNIVELIISACNLVSS